MGKKEVMLCERRVASEVARKARRLAHCVWYATWTWVKGKGDLQQPLPALLGLIIDQLL